MHRLRQPARAFESGSTLDEAPAAQVIGVLASFDVVVEEEERKRLLEAERAERERRKRLEQARIDRLLKDAAAFQQASEIRKYVQAIRSAQAQFLRGPGAVEQTGTG